MTRIATSSASVLGCGLKRGIVRFHVDSPQGYLELGLLKGMAAFDCNEGNQIVSFTYSRLQNKRRRRRLLILDFFPGPTALIKALR